MANSNRPNKRTTFYPQQDVVSFAQEDGDKAKEEKAAAEKAKEKDIKESQWEKSIAAAKVGDTSEKVSIIEPMAYERRQNYNVIDGNPLMRTTFYGQRDQRQQMAQVPEYNEEAGLWMLVNIQEDGDKAREEKAAAAKAKEGDIKESQENKAAAAAKVGDTSEKVSILEPMAYERRQNYNSIDTKPLMRTTFYGQKESEESLLQQQESMGAFYNERDGMWMLSQLD